MRYIVKLSTPWSHDFLKRTPGGSGVFGNFRFVTDDACRECDYWVVWGGLREATKVKCPAQNIVYVTDESHSERRFNPEFLHQFRAVIACRQDIQHPHIIPSHDLGIWHFDKSYDEVMAMDVSHKPKTISVVSSDLTTLAGHKRRYAFVHQLMGHFKDRMDYFGRGINPVADKFLSLADYRYSVAVENSFIPGYFTEKIFECFLTNTLPLYYGCPDLERFFDARAFVRIDIQDYRAALSVIEDVIKSDIHRERLPFLREAKKTYLDRYYFFPAVAQILEADEALKGVKSKTTQMLYPESHFQQPPLKQLYHRIKRRIR